MIVLPQSTDRHPVRCLAFSPDGLTLACAGGKGEGVALWDLVAREPRAVPGGQDGTITSLAFSPDGKRLAAVTSSGLLWVRRLKEPHRLVRQQKWSPPLRHAPAQVAFCPDGRLVATNLDNFASPPRSPYSRPMAVLVSLARQPERGGVVELAAGHGGGLTHLAFSPDGTRLAVGSFDRSVTIIDVQSQERVASLYHGQKVHYVAFSPDGKTLAAGNPQGLVKLWDAATGRKLLTLKGQAKPLRALCYSPDGKVIVTAGGEGVVTFWDVATGKSRTAFDWGIGEVLSVCFAPDGMRAAAGGVGRVVVWDVDGWEV